MHFGLHKWFLAAVLAPLAVPQSSTTENEVWPQVDLYVGLSPQTRFLYTFRGEAGIGHNSGAIDNDFFVEYLLPRFRPVLFRRLIKINDARIQRIVLAVGEELIRSVNAHPGNAENRTVLQPTVRLAFPCGALLTDRSRVELRLVNGVYSWRARDQLRLEKDIRIEGYALTEYASAEAFFDSKTDSVNRFRYIGGVILPVVKQTTIDLYFMRQNSLESAPRFVNVIGLRFSMFLKKGND